MHNNRSDPKTMHRADELHTELTPAEGRLWARLRDDQLYGIRFRRQHAIGRYVVDFCAPTKKLIIELDGSPHLTQKEPDAERTAFLESQGYRVLRFRDAQVLSDIETVLREIAKALLDEC